MSSKLVLLVKCPNCGGVQKCETIKRRTCIYCGHSFVIFPKDKRGNFRSSRIVKILKGDKTLLWKKFYEVYKNGRN